MKDQLSLFGKADSGLPDWEQDQHLAAGMPQNVRFGTSSWTFPGWAGLVYEGQPSERSLVERGLEEYAKHPLFSTVGIDSSYYRPLSESTLSRYARQLPSGFRCVMKVFEEITSLNQRHSGEPNPHFLDARKFEAEVLEPLANFAEHLGPLVFAFAPMRRAHWARPAEFSVRLGTFLSGLSREFQYAVELRNPELYTPAYLEVLAKHGVAHVFNFWERMPSLGEQLAMDASLAAPHSVARLLIPPGQRYAARKLDMAPFNRIVDPQPEMRRDLLELMRRSVEFNKVLFVIVNNKAEGSSPLTIRALMQAWQVAKHAEESGDPNV